MMKDFVTLTFVLLSLVTASTTRAQTAQEPKPSDQMTIVEIMTETNKKPVQLLRKVQTGNASEAEMQRLVDLYKSMQKQEPPKGGLEDWKQRTDLLVDAAERVKRSEEGAVSLLRKATNCMACHKEHKVDE